MPEGGNETRVLSGPKLGVIGVNCVPADATLFDDSDFEGNSSCTKMIEKSWLNLKIFQPTRRGSVTGKEAIGNSEALFAIGLGCLLSVRV